MCVFFFFKQKTAYEMRISDWSSDVCSSDLGLGNAAGTTSAQPEPVGSEADPQGQRHSPHLAKNLLALAVEAARHDATLGDIPAAMEAAFGRYDSVPHPVRGVYTSAYAGDARFARSAERREGDECVSTC